MHIFHGGKTWRSCVLNCFMLPSLPCFFPAFCWSAILTSCYIFWSYWGELEWTPPSVAAGWKVCLYVCLFVPYVHIPYSRSLSALILRILCHSLIQKLLPNYSARRHKPSTSSMVTTREEFNRGPTYSMAGASYCMAKKCFICQCRYLRCHSQWSHSSHGPTSPLATLMRAIACHKRRRKCRHVLQSTWCASPICIQQPYRPGMTCLLD